MDFADIIPREIKYRRCIDHASYSIIVLDYHARNCSFFFASKPNIQMLIDAIRVSAHLTRLIVHKLRYQTVPFWIL